MEAFLISDFWESMETHVALAPGESAGGLQAFLKQKLGEQAWCLFQTSGSEGQRKWVGLTKEKLLTSARAVNAHYDVTERDHWLLALPIYHVGGFGILARAFMGKNAATRLEGRWDAAAFVRQCQDVSATLASLVPTQVFDLVAAKLKAPKSMRAVLVGGGALSSEIEAAALQLGWPLRKTYGMTETASQVASQTVDGGEMEVLPIWDLSTNNEGVLTVRGEALAEGYAAQIDGVWQWEPISAKTGLQTRDCVSLKQKNGLCFLQFRGREANTVKIVGELVALGPIQEQLDVLRLQFGLNKGDAAVCDVPDSRRESRLVLVVSQMSESDAERLRKGLNETLRPFECIQDTCAVKSIPRSQLGKVRMPELRAML